MPDRDELLRSAIPTRSVKAEIERAVAAANTQLSRVEQVRALTVLDADWQPGGPELTNTHEAAPRRHRRALRRQIEEMYA